MSVIACCRQLGEAVLKGFLEAVAHEELSEATMHREDQFIPESIVRNGPAALDFYKSVFGAPKKYTE